MKIFWAWQSDIPGPISRHFIRQCLVSAIEKLKQSEDIQEPTDKERRGGLHIDHDRQGVAGSPDLAATILKKIRDAAAFVGDVTPIGEGCFDRKEGGRSLPRREVMNPNVAIEMGYAFAKLTDERVLMVLNTALGTREGLPFDIAHKGGPITFDLPLKATDAQIKAEAKILTGKFVVALEAILKLEGSRMAVAASLPVFEETPTVDSPAFFFEASENLAESTALGHEAQYKPRWGAAFYLRYIPTVALRRPIPPDELLKRIMNLRTFSLNGGGIPRINKYGAILFDPLNDRQIDSFSQAFRNGEIWGVNFKILANGNYQDPKQVFSYPMESVIHLASKEYAKFAMEFNADINFMLEVGITGVKGWKLQTTARFGTSQSGEMYKADVVTRRKVNISDPVAIDQFLVEAFEAIFDNSGRARPPGLYGLPGLAAYTNNALS